MNEIMPREPMFCEPPATKRQKVKRPAPAHHPALPLRPQKLSS